jgi:uncharacterized protein (DUF697 family)
MTADDTAIDRSIRQKAKTWVNGYMATAVGMVVVATPVPGAASAILCALEATMCSQIGRLYKQAWSMEEAKVAAGVVGLARVIGPIAAMEATLLLGPFAFAAKPAVAAAIVKAMGELVIKHFEDCA